jgi:hypothetical protein
MLLLFTLPLPFLYILLLPISPYSCLPLTVLLFPSLYIPIVFSLFSAIFWTIPSSYPALLQIGPPSIFTHCTSLLPPLSIIIFTLFYLFLHLLFPLGALLSTSSSIPLPLNSTSYIPLSLSYLYLFILHHLLLHFN